MSKQDYELIAKAIRGAGPSKPHVALAIAKALKADNESFKIYKFMQACGFVVE